MFDLAVVAIIRNEAPYLQEWVAYHNVVGVEHFFLYDNCSDDNPAAVLRRHINHGLVTMVDFPMSGAQVPAYTHAVHFFGRSCRWMAFIDLDEFIVPKTDPDIPTMLHRLGNVAQVVLPWRNFGFSGHRAKPAGLVVENFVMAEDIPPEGLAHVPVKSIARAEAIAAADVHVQHMAQGQTVDAHGRPARLQGGVRILQPDYTVAQVNHYFTKSEEEYAHKVARGSANRNPRRQMRTVDGEIGFGTRDVAIAPFVDPTRRRLDHFDALSASPFRYGSHVRLRVGLRDRFVSSAATAMSRFLHDCRDAVSSDQPPAKLRPNLLADSARCYVARAGPTGTVARRRLSSSPHVAQLAVRLEAQRCWDMESSDVALVRATNCSVSSGARMHVVPTGLDATLELPIGDRGSWRHIAVVAAVDVECPMALGWSILPDDGGGEPRQVSLPSSGRYVFVVEVNERLARCDVLRISFEPCRPVVIEDLVVLGYG